MPFFVCGVTRDMPQKWLLKLNLKKNDSKSGAYTLPDVHRTHLYQKNIPPPLPYVENE